jgi:hypothetical protein
VSLLNRPGDGLLSILLALRRAILAFGPQTDAALLKLCAPASVVPDGKPDMARRTLNRWKQIGFFREKDDLVEIGAEITGIAPEDLDGLRAAVLRLVLAPENNPAFAATAPEDDASRASDWTRAAAWALAQDPYSFPSTHKAVEALQDGQGVEPRPFVNDTRWQGFVEWAAFLGVGWTASKVGLVPDPAFAVRALLDDAFLGVAELSQDIFLARLAEALPIVDGGKYRVAVESETSRPWRASRQNEVSPCLSAALLTLEARSDIRLELRSDAPQKVLLGRGGREIRAISHIVRGVAH